jgi:acylpyruvate hydrolase
MKIFCIGRNYADHAKELGNEVPESPVVFMKANNALLKNGQDFYYPEFSKNIQFECELVIKITKNGKHITKKFSKDYYSEMTVGIDFTARDLQTELKNKGLPWELAKAFDHSAVLGDFIPLNDGEILFSFQQNGVVKQEGNSANMIHHFDDLIVFISQYFTLNTGDLIYTGTPAGVGPIAIGDLLSGYIGGKKLYEIKVK